MAAETPQLDHPSIPAVKARFPDAGLKATEFRGQTTVIVPRENLHELMTFLRGDDDETCAYDFLADLSGVDYLDYPAQMPGRFAVVYVLRSTSTDRELLVKVFLNPTVDTSGIEKDEALEVDSVCDIWPGAEWPEREVFDMFGIRFHNHPDLRRILMWDEFPAYPLRKDYPLRGEGERETYRVVDREDA